LHENILCSILGEEDDDEEEDGSRTRSRLRLLCPGWFKWREVLGWKLFIITIYDDDDQKRGKYSDVVWKLKLKV
jgi:hypothetical protein